MCVAYKIWEIELWVEEQCAAIEWTRGKAINRIIDTEINVIYRDIWNYGHPHRIFSKPWTHNFPCPSWQRDFEVCMIQYVPIRGRLFA